MSDAPRTGQLPIDERTDETGAPVTHTEVDTGRQPGAVRDEAGTVVESDGSGMAGGSSGGSGGGSSMPGHPDAAR